MRLSGWEVKGKSTTWQQLFDGFRRAHCMRRGACSRGRDRSPRPEARRRPQPAEPEQHERAAPAREPASVRLDHAVGRQGDRDHQRRQSSPRPTSTSGWRCWRSPMAGKIPADEVDRLRQQVLRNLIDETLQIQAAKTEKITIKPGRHRPDARARRREREADARAAGAIPRIQRIVDQVSAPPDRGRNRVAAAAARQDRERVSVGDDEVKAVIDKLNASKGTEEYHVGEIFLSATAGSQAQVLANANKILEQLKNGASFAGYARQYSEASTAAVGGDLGWVRPEQLPAADRRRAPADGAGNGQQPDPSPGRRFDRRRPGHAQGLDRRPARCGPQPQAGLGHLPQGHHAAAGRAGRGAIRRGCAKRRRLRRRGQDGRRLSRRDRSERRSRCATCRRRFSRSMLPMQVGQATQPFGSIEEGVRVLVICGRDEVDSGRADLRPGLQPDQRRAGQHARAPVFARSSPRRGDRIPLEPE